MTVTESEILIALRQLEAEAARRGPVLPILQRINTLTRSLPIGTDPDLLHYLHKHSFEKARIHLEQGSQPPGPDTSDPVR